MRESLSNSLVRQSGHSPCVSVSLSRGSFSPYWISQL